MLLEISGIDLLDVSFRQLKTLNHASSASPKSLLTLKPSVNIVRVMHAAP
jgi:hypothetical protein